MALRGKGKRSCRGVGRHPAPRLNRQRRRHRRRHRRRRRGRRGKESRSCRGSGARRAARVSGPRSCNASSEDIYPRSAVSARHTAQPPPRLARLNTHPQREPASQSECVGLPCKHSAVGVRTQHSENDRQQAVGAHHDLSDCPGDEVARTACDGTVQHHEAALLNDRGVCDLGLRRTPAHRHNDMPQRNGPRLARGGEGGRGAHSANMVKSVTTQSTAKIVLALSTPAASMIA